MTSTSFESHKPASLSMTTWHTYSVPHNSYLCSCPHVITISFSPCPLLKEKMWITVVFANLKAIGNVPCWCQFLALDNFVCLFLLLVSDTKDYCRIWHYILHRAHSPERACHVYTEKNKVKKWTEDMDGIAQWEFIMEVARFYHPNWNHVDWNRPWTLSHRSSQWITMIFWETTCEGMHLTKGMRATLQIQVWMGPMTILSSIHMLEKGSMEPPFTRE